MKYKSSVVIAHGLGLLLAQHINDCRLSLPDQIIPMPLHPGRLAGRGYNQSLEITRPLARTLDIPLNIKACKRIRATQAQSELPAQKRKHNVRKAFEVVARMEGKHVAIVDDVMTTGCTVNELARTLVAAGVERVDVWVCARAVNFK
jgi:ComF family protein